MRYLALACDYDGTIAAQGRVDEETLQALRRLKESGRKLILVTGRELPDLQEVFAHLELFDRVVAENGALLYRPAAREEKVLAEPPAPAFVNALKARGVAPLSAGRSIVATWQPHETTVMEVIRDLGLELHVVFNKGAVMVLPAAINKETGLRIALNELCLSPHNTVGVGDAENDHAFLSLCEFSVAVANALPALKQRADWVTSGARSQGVIELIDALLADDLESFPANRHRVLLGTAPDGERVWLNTFSHGILFAGPSGTGKSTMAVGVLERLAEQAYQFCLVDPEGDYETFAGAVVLGDAQRSPSVEEVVQVLQHPDQSVVVNLLALPLPDRPAFLALLLPRLQELRTHTGRPHWLAIDEAHHLLPRSWEPDPVTLPPRLGGLILITVHTHLVSRAALDAVDVMAAVHQDAAGSLRGFSQAVGQPLPTGDLPELEQGHALVWFRRTDDPPFPLKMETAHIERRRHRRKYAKGDVGEKKSFYFRGPEGKLKLRAQNLAIFVQIAEGVDDETWLHHLRSHHFSQWFRDAIKDDGLAEQAQQIEDTPGLSADESRQRMRAAIEERYTAAA